MSLALKVGGRLGRLGATRMFEHCQPIQMDGNFLVVSQFFQIPRWQIALAHVKDGRPNNAKANAISVEHDPIEIGQYLNVFHLRPLNPPVTPRRFSGNGVRTDRGRPHEKKSERQDAQANVKIDLRPEDAPKAKHQ
ncbi:MAG: hypothetical protein V4739_16685 [Pseudomonadota bacterium]